MRAARAVSTKPSAEIRRALLAAREVTAHVLQSYDLASAGSRMRGVTGLLSRV